ncbi:hypothetical protein B0J17DRAFT_661891 [Rhizoctonia solani]|nr:hypothetical protein B0J17DRAFT_661891 [Rhizoctonia solani]
MTFLLSLLRARSSFGTCMPPDIHKYSRRLIALPHARFGTVHVEELDPLLNGQYATPACHVLNTRVFVCLNNLINPRGLAISACLDMYSIHISAGGTSA